jgi:hypothetical protein
VIEAGDLFMKNARLLWHGLLLVFLTAMVAATPWSSPCFGRDRGTGETWSKGDEAVEIAKGARWGRPETLIDHFRRHGADFGAKTPGEYAEMASVFFVRAQREQLPKKIAPDGTIRIYDRKTNTFGAYNPDGTTKTFFKPKEGQKYWNRQ